MRQYTSARRDDPLVHALFGPVFVKEMVAVARRWPYYALRMLAGAVLLPTLAGLEGLNATSISRQARIAEFMFESWVHWQFWLLTLATPLLVAPAVARERERGTYDLLLTTHLSDAGVVWGMVASRLALAFFLFLGAFPAVVLLALLGGVDWVKFLQYTAVTASAVLLGAAVAAFASVRAERVWIAIVVTAFALLMLWIVIPTMIFFIFWAGVLPSIYNARSAATLAFDSQWFDVVVGLSPLQALRGIGAPRGLWPVILTPESIVVVCVIVQLTLAAVCYRRTVRSVRRPMESRSKLQGLITYFSVFRDRLIAALGRLIPRTKPRVAAQPSRLLDFSPTIWRNTRAAALDPSGRLHAFQWALATILAFSLFVSLTIPSGTIKLPGEHYGPYLTVVLLAGHLIAAAVAGSSFARERERRTLELLRLADVPIREVVLGNVVGALWAARVLLVGAVGVVVVGTLIGDWLPGYALRFLGLQTLLAFALVTAAVWISAAADRAETGVLLALLFTSNMWFGWQGTAAAGQLVYLLAIVGASFVVLRIGTARIRSLAAGICAAALLPMLYGVAGWVTRIDARPILGMQSPFGFLDNRFAEFHWIFHLSSGSSAVVYGWSNPILRYFNAKSSDWESTFALGLAAAAGMFFACTWWLLRREWRAASSPTNPQSSS